MPREFFTDFVRVAQDEGRHFTLLAARLEEVGSHYGALPAHDGLWDSALQTSKSLLARLAVEHCVHEVGDSFFYGLNCLPARGLDVLPTTISRFRNGGDEQTANLLETVVYPEEITHCAAGVKWFRYLCLRTPNEHDGAALIHDSTGSAQPLEGVSIPNQHEVDHGGDADLTQDLAQNFKTTVALCHGEQEMVIQHFHATVREYFRGPLKPPFNVQARKAAGFGPEWYEPLAQK
ncbi:hypothetical protein GW17_00030915 [Ensete ventricosum]|nr:hypothetical protein GW17_00030915 [Ensete ventricosum]